MKVVQATVMRPEVRPGIWAANGILTTSSFTPMSLAAALASSMSSPAGCPASSTTSNGGYAKELAIDSLPPSFTFAVTGMSPAAAPPLTIMPIRKEARAQRRFAKCSFHSPVEEMRNIGPCRVSGVNAVAFNFFLIQLPEFLLMSTVDKIGAPDRSSLNCGCACA